MPKTLTALVLTLLTAINFAFAEDLKPNIVIFYVDDLGWQDVQLNDLDDPCPYETPNLVKLAEQGMNFTEGYASAPTCAPSRAGIITGQHPAKLRFTHVTASSIPMGRKTEEFVEPYLGAHMPLDALTLATAPESVFPGTMNIQLGIVCCKTIIGRRSSCLRKSRTLDMLAGAVHPHRFGNVSKNHIESTH